MENFNLLSPLLHFSSIPLPHILLPLALSFVTFQQIAFLVDTSRSKDLKRIDFLDYCLFITFFPQLIAGPIVHHKEMMPQFASLLSKSKALVNWEFFAKGLFLFSIGLFKKVVIADQFGIYVDNGHKAISNGEHLNFFESWITSLSYTFQLYFDFSGYCDMAMGIALFFGIVLPINFNSPYQALSIKEFWKKWHITLGRFLREYVYVPLGGNQRGLPRELVNLFIVFFLSGVWHGAGWGFVLWGILHAGAMIIHRIYTFILQKLGLIAPKIWIYRVFCLILTFNFINASWVFFRSESVSGAIDLLKSMVGLNGVVLPSILEKYQNHFIFSWIRNFWNLQYGDILQTLHFSKTLFILYLCLLYLLIFLERKWDHQKALHALSVGFLCAIAICYLNRPTSFIYFNF